MSNTAPPDEARSGPVHAPARGPLIAIAGSTLVLFASLGAFVSAHPRTAFDDSARSWALGANSPSGTSFFTRVSTVGSVTPMIVYAVIVVAFVAFHRRSMVLPLTVLFAPAVAVLAYLGSKSLVMRPRPSGVGNAFEGTYSFPSAHATTSSAVCCAVAYLLYREGLVSGLACVVGGTIICLLIGLSRVYLDVHWATDVMGGWCLGIAIGAGTSALYATGITTSAARAGRYRP